MPAPHRIWKRSIIYHHYNKDWHHIQWRVWLPVSPSRWLLSHQCGKRGVITEPTSHGEAHHTPPHRQEWWNSKETRDKPSNQLTNHTDQSLQDPANNSHTFPLRGCRLRGGTTRKPPGEAKGNMSRHDLTHTPTLIRMKWGNKAAVWPGNEAINCWE